MMMALDDDDRLALNEHRPSLFEFFSSRYASGAIIAAFKIMLKLIYVHSHLTLYDL